MKYILIPIFIINLNFCAFSQTSEEHLQQGLLNFENESYDLALDNFNKAIELDPNRPLLYYLKGRSKSAVKNYEEAILEYSKAIEINPKYAHAYYSRSFSNYSLGNFQEAIHDCNKALEINSKVFEAYYVRGLCKIEIGQNEEGCNDLNLAKKLGHVKAVIALADYCEK